MLCVPIEVILKAPSFVSQLPIKLIAKKDFKNTNHLLMRQLGFRLQMLFLMPLLVSVEENDEYLGMHMKGEAL